MSRDDDRGILERLAAGEITADEADAALGGAGSPGGGAAPGRDRRRRVSARLSGGGRIEVQGGAVDRPRVAGPSRCTITEDGGRVRVDGMLGDDGVLLVPDECDLSLHLNGASAAITGVRGTLDATINAGDVAVGCAIDGGDSTWRLNAGTVRVRLATSSDVRITVLAPTSVTAGAPFTDAGRGQWLLGSGRGTLEVDGNIGELVLQVV